MAVSLPDYLNNENEDSIRARMLQYIQDNYPDLDITEGSYIWDSIAPASIELALAAIWAQQVLQRSFASTTYDSYLDLRCDEHGITRKSAVQAIGQVTFIGTVGTFIPFGTKVATPADSISGVSSIEFVTLADATIGSSGSVTVTIQASVAGTSGNVSANKITIVSTPISGIVSVTNPVAISGGVNTESDSDLLVRFYLKVRSPGTSGNKSDYIQWALNVNGVGGAQVQPLWNGAGTVKVFVIDSNKQPASTAIINNVQSYIDPSSGDGSGQAPIGATVTVVAATSVPITVTANITLDGTQSIANIRTAFTSSLNSYLQSITFGSDPSVKYVRVGSLLLDTQGVSDYQNLTINGGTSNVNITLGQVATLGTVALS